VKIGQRVAGGTIDNVTTLALNGLEMCLINGHWHDARFLTPIEPEPKMDRPDCLGDGVKVKPCGS
jgi:hypothetical protein